MYRYNPKHLCPKLNGYGDNDQRKVWSSCGSTYYTYQLRSLSCCPCVRFPVTAALVLASGYVAAVLWMVGRLVVWSCWTAFCVFTRGILWYAYCVWILRWQCTCWCWRITKAFSRSKNSISRCIYAHSPDIAWYWVSSQCFCAVWKEGGVNDKHKREHTIKQVLYFSTVM
jgi:hypothetical protein